MKRYLLFASYDYEAKGGAFDLKGDFDSIEQCKKIDLTEYDDTHVLDTQTGNVTVLTGEMTYNNKKKTCNCIYKGVEHLCEWCNPD